MRKRFLLLSAVLACCVFSVFAEGVAQFVSSPGAALGIMEKDSSNTETGAADKAEDKSKSNKKPFFYYIVNEQFKANLRIGFSAKKCRLGGTDPEYSQTAGSLDAELLYHPVKHSGFFLRAALSANVPFFFDRKCDGTVHREKNFDNGMYLSLSPNVAAGLGFDLVRESRISVECAAGIGFDVARVRALSGAWEKLRTVDLIASLDLRWHVNQRYSVLFSARGAVALWQKLENKSLDAEGRGFSIGVGLGYDF